VKPVPNSRIMKRTLLIIKGHLRPYRSLAIPNMIAPTDLSMRTSVIPQVISLFFLPNCLARSVTVYQVVSYQYRAPIGYTHQRDCEEIKRIQCPRKESHEEKCPLLPVQQSQRRKWIRSVVHRWFQGGDSSSSIFTNRVSDGWIISRQNQWLVLSQGIFVLHYQ
jgi:hypothetical protein